MKTLALSGSWAYSSLGTLERHWTDPFHYVVDLGFRLVRSQ